MYQSIDIIDMDENETENSALMSQNDTIWPVLNPNFLYHTCLFIFFAFIALTYFNAPHQIAENTQQEARTPYAEYLLAVKEPNAALRRARFQDFLKMNPHHVRAKSARAQLEVINAYETRDWNYITQLAYVTSLSHDDRLDEIENYSDKWGGNLLGGRGDDLTDLSRNILAIPDRNAADRRLNAGLSPISTDILDSRLLGEPPRLYASAPIYRPAAQPIYRSAPRSDVVTAPKVRRQVTPRYPRKALNREIEAMVTLRLNIDEKGKVEYAELVDVTAPRYSKDFIKAAKRAAMRTRFDPQTINGKAVPASGLMKRYRFKANG